MRGPNPTEYLRDVLKSVDRSLAMVEQYSIVINDDLDVQRFMESVEVSDLLSIREWALFQLRYIEQKQPKIAVKFAWYDLWVGVYIDRKKEMIYVCLVPMFVIEIWYGGIR